MLPKQFLAYRSLLFAAVQLGTFIFFFMHLQEVIASGAFIRHYPWIPELGLNLDLRLDSLSLSFGLLVSGIGVIVFLFAHQYMKTYDGKRFLSAWTRPSSVGVLLKRGKEAI